MSFSSEAKKEICRLPVGKKCCAVAECYGVLLFCNRFSSNMVRLVTESGDFAERLPLLLQKAFDMEFDVQPDGTTSKYVFLMQNQEKIASIREAFGIAPGTFALHINYPVLEEDCCRTAFLRGAFLAGGSVTDPEKRYHLELATGHAHVTRELSALLKDEGFSPKETTRAGHYMTYFKHSESIEDFLTRLGAPVAAMNVMNVKVEKSIRGITNRQVNCDAANLDKTVAAAQEQIVAIRSLERTGKLTMLPDKLRQTAILRVEHPELTLAQLAELCDPPVSKSALNHRLRKLQELASNHE